MKKYVMFKEINGYNDMYTYSFIGIHNEEEQDFVNCLITLSVLANDLNAEEKYIFTEVYFDSHEVEAFLKMNSHLEGLGVSYQVIEYIDLEEVCNIFLHASSFNEQVESQDILIDSFYRNGIESFEKNLDTT